MIACLGWGSLIWNAGKLRLNGDWHGDGPRVKVEFVRRSKGDRLTLALFAHAERAPSSLWAWMDVGSLEEAVCNLACREGTPQKHIGQWPHEDGAPMIIGLESWAKEHGAEHVIWTALPPRWRNDNGEWKNGHWPTVADAICHLNDLAGNDARCAEQYVRCAPEQINTAYRERFADFVLKWTPWSLDECRCNEP